MWHREHWTAISLLWGFIASAHRDLFHWRSNQKLHKVEPWLVNLAWLLWDMDWWPSGRVSALLSVVGGSISSIEDHGIHCWWDLIRSKQLPSVPYVARKYLPDSLAMVFQLLYIYVSICVCVCVCVALVV